uniref:Asparagine synthetase [glutamine-hydrolyzing] n=1 Tax=Meloidogyne incognita TaxID=6306 RepID=A0A914N8Z6_MELIC
PTKHQTEFLRIAGRGPDLAVIQRVAPNVWLGFHWLSIIQSNNSKINTSTQPICAQDLSVVCNGEIYNHLILKRQSSLDNSLVRNGGSDCSAIIHSFLENGRDLRHCCSSLDGVFAFIMSDNNFVYIGRDPLGIRPLFYGINGKSLFFGSELKSIEKLCDQISFFPPGCCAKIPLKNIQNNLTDWKLEINSYWKIGNPAIEINIGIVDAQTAIRQLLVEAVHKRLMGERQFGFMLSGGLDSSLIAALATQQLIASGRSLPIAFSVGFSDSADLENARIVANYLRIPHRVLVINPQQCIEIIPEVIYALETFDPLVVRCGIPHFILCRYISNNSNVKVLLSGEGADELFGSYSYMQRAPTALLLHQEVLRRLKLLHQYDVLRCDRCTSPHGLEIRVPFLDKKFVSFISRLQPSFKLISGKIEKYILRKTFKDLLPPKVLWRSKEGFSEALGKMDIGELLEKTAELLISDIKFDERKKLFPSQTPETKEEFWYRSLFEQKFEINKLERNLIHTKVYRSAAWQNNKNNNFEESNSLSESSGDEGKENKNLIGNLKNNKLNIPNEGKGHIRRRSTGSIKL